MTYCSLPWVHLAVDPTGSVRPCCNSTDLIKKPDGTKFNLGYDSIEEIFNSSEFIEIRRKMLNGEKIDGCSQCYNTEKYGGKSERLRYNELYVEKYTSTVAEIKFKYLDLRLGNMCNLSCKSCIPINSSQLENEVNEINSPILNKHYNMTIGNLTDWYNTDRFDQNVFNNLENVDWLYMTGGEPTIIKKNFELLEKLIELKHNKNIKLKINSNLTNLNPKFLDLISQFHTVIFFVSIDGYGEIQEYIRYPSNWNQIKKNFEKLLQYDNFVIRPSPVIQVTNLNKLVDLFEYFESFNRKLNTSRIIIFPLLLEKPVFLDVLNLPLDYKKKCWDRIEEWMKTCRFQNQVFYDKMQILKNKCLIDVDYKDNLKRYLEFNLEFDKHRGHDLQKINPELYSIL